MGPGARTQCSNVTATFSLLTVQLHLGEFVEGLFFGLGSFFIGRCTLSRYFEGKGSVIGNLQHNKS